MKSKMLFYSFVLFLSYSDLVFSFVQQDNKDTVGNALKILQIQPNIDIKVRQTQQSLNASFKINVEIKNLTDVAMALEEIQILLPGQFADARDADPVITKTLNSEDLFSGNNKIFYFDIPRNQENIFEKMFNASQLTFMPGDYIFDVVVRFRIPPQSGVKDLQQSVKIHLEPPMSSIIEGGILGTFILAVFLFFYPLLNKDQTVKLNDLIIKSIVRLAVGSVSVIIVVVLLFRFKEVPLPITLDVNDFYGGIVIGLFTLKLSDWIYNQMNPKKELSKPKNA